MESNKKIRNARRDAKMRQSELAAKCGMHPSQISTYERSVRTPKLDTLVTIAKALNISPMSLLPDSFLDACNQTK